MGRIDNLQQGGTSEIDRLRACVDGLRALLSDCRLPYFETDTAGKVTQWNDRAVEVLGVRANAVLGSPLEDAVANEQRSRVSQALARAHRLTGGSDLGSIVLRARHGHTKIDTLFRLAAFCDRSGKVLGMVGLAQPTPSGTDRATTSLVRTALPAPVGGVAAWRCSLQGTVSTWADAFEMSKPRSACSDMHEEGLGKPFCQMVERAVRCSLPPKGMNDDRPTPFESAVLPFNDADGTTRYFCIRGVAQSGPELLFGSNMGHAEGYVIDLTTVRHHLHEVERWHERWRSLARLTFDFSLLIDITDIRVISAWGDLDIFGEYIEGRSFLEFVAPHSHETTLQAFDAGHLNHGIQSEALIFCQAQHAHSEENHIYTECDFVSDSEDPGLIFLGARRVNADGGGKRVCSKTERQSTGGVPLRHEGVGAQHEDSGGKERTGNAQLERVRDEAGSPPTAKAERTAAATPTAKSSVKLTAAALGLASMTAPRPRPGEGSRGMAAAGPRDLPKATGKPPVHGSSIAAPPRGAVSRRMPTRSPATSRSGSCTSQGLVSRGVFRTVLVLYDDAGDVLWRSPTQLLGEHLHAAELLTRETTRLAGMPEDFSERLQADTHVLYVLDDTSGELLQVASLTGTSLQSLQRHCGADGLLTIVIKPVGDSEDDFEILPSGP